MALAGQIVSVLMHTPTTPLVLVVASILPICAFVGCVYYTLVRYLRVQDEVCDAPVMASSPSGRSRWWPRWLCLRSPLLPTTHTIAKGKGEALYPNHNTLSKTRGLVVCHAQVSPAGRERDRRATVSVFGGASHPRLLDRLELELTELLALRRASMQPAGNAKGYVFKDINLSPAIRLKRAIIYHVESRSWMAERA